MSQIIPEKISTILNSQFNYQTLPVTPFNYKFLFETFVDYLEKYFKLVDYRIWEINLEKAGC